MNKNKYMVSAEEIAEKLCISKAHAYKLVRQMNMANKERCKCQ